MNNKMNGMKFLLMKKENILVLMFALVILFICIAVVFRLDTQKHIVYIVDLIERHNFLWKGRILN